MVTTIFEVVPNVCLNNTFTCHRTNQYIFLRFLCSRANNSLDYQPLFVKWAHASLLHGTIGDCTRELGANRTPQPSPSPPKTKQINKRKQKKKKEQRSDQLVKMWLFTFGIIEWRRQSYKLQMERIILLIVQKPFSSDFLFDVGEREFLPSYLFFVYRLVCNRILGMVPESVEGVLQHHVSSENNTMGPRQHGTH